MGFTVIDEKIDETDIFLDPTCLDCLELSASLGHHEGRAATLATS